MINTGHGGGHGRRIQEGGYRGQEEPAAKTTGQHAIFPSDRNLRLISRSFGSGALFVGCNRFILVYLLVLYSLRRKELNKLQNTIYRDLAFFFGDDSPKTAPSYYTDKKISDDTLKQMGLFNFNLLKCNGNDYTYVQYDNSMLCFSDIQLYQYVDKEEEIYKNGTKYLRKYKDKEFFFDGIYMGFPLKQKNTSQIFLIPNSIKNTLYDSRIMDYIIYQGAPIKLQNQTFAKKYKVYSYDEEQTNKILSNGLMDRINKIDSIFNTKKYIVFKEGTRFAICLNDVRITDIKKRIKPLTFRIKGMEFKRLCKNFEAVRYLYMIYQILAEENN